MAATTKHLYKRLAERFDKTSFGIPRWLGIERILLKRLFSEVDAQTFLGMEPARWYTPVQFCEFNGGAVEVAAEKLESMAKRALLYRRHRDGVTEYRHPAFAFGFMEFQAENPKFPYFIWSLMSFLSGGAKLTNKFMPFYRTIPIRSELVNGSKVLPYDDLDALLDRHTRFAIARCMCRENLSDPEKCKHPRGTCTMTDDMADFFVENGMGRSATREEVAAMLRSGEKDGRIIQVTNSQNAENICSCCKCACGLFQLLKLGGPGVKQWSNHHVVHDDSLCTLCGDCISRCNVSAISKKDGKLVTDLERCLGCGLCAAACPRKARSLARKPDAQLYEPPVTMEAAQEKWASMRMADQRKRKS